MDTKTLRNLIDSGQKNYINKTRIYLAPCMEMYGEEVITTINNLNYFWCGINPSTPYIINYVYDFTNQGRVIKTINKYIVNEFTIDDKLHLISLRIPKFMHRAYSKFILFKYSKMYFIEDMQNIFINPDPRFGNIRWKELALPVLLKHPKRKELFEDHINSLNTPEFDNVEPITLDEFSELDFRWKKKHEILEL